MSGIFGVRECDDCVTSLFYGTDYHTHLGTAYGGLAVWGDELVRKIHSIRTSQFKSKFGESLDDLGGRAGIGVVSAAQTQPVVLNTRFGRFALIMNGWIDNAEEIAAAMFDQGHSFAEVRKGAINQVELVAKLINEGGTFQAGIQKVFDMIEGSCTMLILTEKGIYAARDRYGYSPLILGKSDRGWAFTTETGAFVNLGYQVMRDLAPGEIVFLGDEGPKTLDAGSDKSHTCAFYWVYTGFPASGYEGINSEVARNRCGACLARRDGDWKPDIVGGVPDSGVAHAVGYAMESGIPFRRPLVKYTPGYGRSYTPTRQSERDLVAKMKLLPVRDLIEDKRVLICEDSIVRGTQLKSYTVQKLWEAGAKEVHVRVACPPLLWPCKYNISTRSRNELIGRRAITAIEGRELEDISAYTDHRTDQFKRMVEWIARETGVTSIVYQTVEDMVSAIGLPRESLCTYCWTGEELVK